MSSHDKPILVFQTDFTYAEGAVSSMYGVVKSVDRELEIFDGTHQIPQYDTWSASYRLYQSMPFWPKGTIYVSVVDPGVGTDRRACAARTADGHVVITPDNGSLTHVYNNIGITEVRQIDETINRLPSTRGTSVFAGRDVFGYTAARLASGVISWEQVGPAYPIEQIVRHAIPNPHVEGHTLQGIVEICDPNFGNAWTNIGWDSLESIGLGFGGTARVVLSHGEHIVLDQGVAIERSFGLVPVGEPIVYCNEVMNVALALCQGSLCDTFGVGFGPDWHITLRRSVL